MTRFRPCIDLHEGRVKQVVGGSFDRGDAGVLTNFVSELPAEHYAGLYRRDGLGGGHIIQLGGGNEAAARAALAAWPGGMQLGGGVTPENAAGWLEAGASAVIVTSALFNAQGRFREELLRRLLAEVGRDRLVLDLSCRRSEGESGPRWRVAMARWTKPTELWVDAATLRGLAASCAEFLIHAADVEGRQAGMDEELLTALGEWSPIPVTYAGGARSLEDLELAQRLSAGRVDVTIGSALDIFGGRGVAYADCVAWNRRG